MLPAAILANPAGPAIAVIVVAAALGGTWLHGHSVGRDNANNACAASRLESVQRAITQAQEIAAQDAEVSADYENWRVKYVDRWRQIDITKEVPADCSLCRLTPAGLGLLNRAIGGGMPEATNSGKPDATLPGPAATHNGQFSRGDKPFAPDQHSLQRLSGSAPSVSREGI